MPPDHCSSRGMALMLCLLMMTSLGLIGTVAMRVAALDRKCVVNSHQQTQAFYMAEAGRQMTLAHLSADPLWRGDAPGESPNHTGEMTIGNKSGRYSLVFTDRTDDDRGALDTLLPSGYVKMISTGTWMDASRTVSCLFCISPKIDSVASLPMVAVLSSGNVSGVLIAVNDFGATDMSLIQTSALLPELNDAAVKSMADSVFAILDNDTFDGSLAGLSSFWRNAPAQIDPFIFHVQGDLTLSGSRTLYGIFLVAGETVCLEDEVRVEGIIYAPDATDVSLGNTGVSGRVMIKGQLITGTGGVDSVGDSAAVQLWPDYVDAFSNAGGAEVRVDLVAGSWRG